MAVFVVIQNVYICMWFFLSCNIRFIKFICIVSYSCRLLCLLLYNIQLCKHTTIHLSILNWVFRKFLFGGWWAYELHDPDNHNGVITHTHLEPDILECEVKWALGSITKNKDSGGDGIPVELYQVLKMVLWKCCTQYVSKFGKLISGHKTRKGQFSFQSQRKAMPKNAQTTAQLHSLSHTLVK